MPVIAWWILGAMGVVGSGIAANNLTENTDDPVTAQERTLSKSNYVYGIIIAASIWAYFKYRSK